MPTKAEKYAQMADEQAVRLTRSWQEWASFLTTASRLYKYPYHEQLLIYAQRPDATACADYELWNKRMGRYVRRGSTGIALLDDSGDRVRLRYVFDISDTGERENSRRPFLWSMEESHIAPVQAMIEQSDGRKLGLDQRIINPLLPDQEGTKVNQCVSNIMKVWRDGETDKLTQLVFCDISTPKPAPSRKVAKGVTGNLDNPELHALETSIPLPEEQPGFTVYDDIRSKLIAQGVPPEQIAFIHEANTEVRKKELFAKVRTGQVRVLLGSTSKMGAGTNVQDRLVAIHDLDCPWRPGDLAQRKGRIERQGNQNPLVHVFRYVTEGTFDAYLWQTVEKTKQHCRLLKSRRCVPVILVSKNECIWM